MKKIVIGICSLCLLPIAGCGPKRIPGLDVEVADTPDHRALLKVLNEYKLAFEERNIKALVALASPRFYETSGSADTKDDYNYDGLEKHFTQHFQYTENCSLNISLKHIEVQGQEAMIDFHYVTRYLMKLPSGEKWQITDDLNRMKFVKENGQWKIISGM